MQVRRYAAGRLRRRSYGAAVPCPSGGAFPPRVCDAATPLAPGARRRSRFDLAGSLVMLGRRRQRGGDLEAELQRAPALKIVRVVCKCRG